MANPPAIITSSLPPERLNQIATGKLASLGLRVRLDGASQQLRGELAFRAFKLTLAGGTPPPQVANFKVVGHDHLEFTAPPLSALGPIMFYDLPALPALEERVAAALQQRLASLAAIGDGFKRLRVPTRFDGDTLQLVGQVKTVTHAFELTADPAGTRVSRVAPANASPVVLSEPFHLVDLARFEAIIDLELHLAEVVTGLLEGAAALRRAGPKPVATPPVATLEAVPPPGNAVTLGVLAQKLGGAAALGASRPGEITQDFTFKGATYRFAATHVSGTTFKASLSGPQGEKWSDRFDLLRFPGIASVVATVLGAQPAVRDEASAAPAPVGPSPFPSHLKPQVGEVWVMNVLIEREDAAEVRYACANVDGKPFGATRILRRSEFEDVFVQGGTAWRLLIVMDEIRPDHSVVYRQLDRHRQPRGAPKRMEGAILVTTFIPEAMAY
ncbi:MAG: hypothetical protein IPJ65_38735 [Archangiaceae bacterium]|nr:hypothetical protein [Archangiaceae bacterium]